MLNGDDAHFKELCLCLRRPKKMKYQSEENEEKVLPDTMMEDDETIFKKPKIPRVSPLNLSLLIIQ